LGGFSRGYIKNVENADVKSTPGAPTSLRSATPSSIPWLDMRERG
jgi:hypothetical protein